MRLYYMSVYVFQCGKLPRITAVCGGTLPRKPVERTSPSRIPRRGLVTRAIRGDFSAGERGLESYYRPLIRLNALLTITVTIPAYKAVVM